MSEKIARQLAKIEHLSRPKNEEKLIEIRAGMWYVAIGMTTKGIVNHGKKILRPKIADKTKVLKEKRNGEQEFSVMIS